MLDWGSEVLMAPPLKPITMALGKDITEPIVGIRKAMAKAMTRAQQIPHFGYDDEVRSTLFLCSIVKNFPLRSTDA